MSPPHRPDAIEGVGSLKQHFHGPVCLELSKGPLVYALQKYDYLKLFPVNRQCGKIPPGPSPQVMPRMISSMFSVADGYLAKVA